MGHVFVCECAARVCREYCGCGVGEGDPFEISTILLTIQFISVQILPISLSQTFFHFMSLISSHHHACTSLLLSLSLSIAFFVSRSATRGRMRLARPCARRRHTHARRIARTLCGRAGDRADGGHSGCNWGSGHCGDVGHIGRRRLGSQCCWKCKWQRLWIWQWEWP